LVRMPEGKGLLSIPRYKWEDNIRLDLREKRWEGADWMHLAQDRNQWWVLVNAVKNIWVQLKAGNFLII